MLRICVAFFLGICKRRMAASSGIIESPNYPKNYLSTTQCAWTIDFGSGIYVELEFIEFVLEEKSVLCFDYLSLHNGSNETTPMLQGTEKHCGQIQPPKQTHLGPLTIFFLSDKDTDKKGFSARYRTWGM